MEVSGAAAADSGGTAVVWRCGRRLEGRRAGGVSSVNFNEPFSVDAFFSTNLYSYW
jgi:hypothetical protein